MSATTQHDVQLAALFAACRHADVAELADVDPILWASTASPRVVTSDANGYVAGLHRGRLPMVEIFHPADAWEHQAIEGGTITATWTVRVHVNGPSWAAADSLARLIGQGCLAKIRTTEYLREGGEVFAGIQADPLGFHLDISLTMTHAYCRQSYEITPDVPPVPLALDYAIPDQVDESQDVPFVIIGTGFDQAPITGMDAYVTGFGSVPIVGWTLDSATQITTPAGIVPAILALPGVNAPVQFQFQVNQGSTYAQGAPVDIAAIVPADPMADAIFPPWTGAPGEVAVLVETVSQYALMAQELPYQLSFPIPPQAPAAEEWSLAVWFRRRDFTGGLTYFASLFEVAWNAQFHNGALNNIQGLIPDAPIQESPPASYDPADFGWHMAVLTHSWTGVDTLRLYVDGAEVDFGSTVPGHYIAGGNVFTVGFDNLPGQANTQATGAVWLRALSGPEVALIWAGTTPPP